MPWPEIGQEQAPKASFLRLRRMAGPFFRQKTGEGPTPPHRLIPQRRIRIAPPSSSLDTGILHVVGERFERSSRLCLSPRAEHDNGAASMKVLLGVYGSM